MDYFLLIVTVISFGVATKFKGRKWYYKVRWRPLALQCLFFYGMLSLVGWVYIMVLIAGTVVIFFLPSWHDMRLLPAFRYQAGKGDGSSLCHNPMHVSWGYLRVGGTGRTKARPRDTLHTDTDRLPPWFSLFSPVPENT